MGAAVSEATQITLAVFCFFAFLALVALVRTWVTKRAAPRRVRVGVFIERDDDERE